MAETLREGAAVKAKKVVKPKMQANKSKQAKRAKRPANEKKKRTQNDDNWNLFSDLHILQNKEN